MALPDFPTAEEIAGSWTQIKGRLREKWGQLTDDELEAAKGSAEQLLGYLERKTSLGKEELERVVRQAYEQSAGLLRTTNDRLGRYASRLSDTVHSGYEQAAGKLGQEYGEAKEFVRSRPAESVGMAFLGGILCGALLALLIKSD